MQRVSIESTRPGETSPGLINARSRDDAFMARVGIALADVQIQDGSVLGAGEVTSLFAGTELPRALVRGMGPIITVGLRRLGYGKSDVVFIKQELENGITTLRNERQLAEETARRAYLAQKAMELTNRRYRIQEGYWS